MKYLADIGVVAIAVSFMGWLLKSYLDRRFSAQFSKIEKLQEITLQLTSNRLKEAYEALNELQRTATGTRNALKKINSNMNKKNAEEFAAAFDEMEATLYSRQLVIPVSAWKSLHIHKKLYDVVITRIRVNTPEMFAQKESNIELCENVGRYVEPSHEQVQDMLRTELQNLESHESI